MTSAPRDTPEPQLEVAAVDGIGERASQTLSAALVQAALAEVGPLRGGTRVESDAIARRQVGEPSACWVASFGGAEVGFVAAAVRVDGQGTKTGVLDALYVDAGCRGIGIGEALVGRALEWFRSEGCSGADAFALPGARATKNFFEETGFTARSLTMHLPL